MWTNPGTPVPIDPSQVTIGLYVWLDVKWTEHPFLSNRFLVEKANDVAVIQALNVKGKLYYFPNNSKVPPARAALAPEELEAAEQAKAEGKIKSFTNVRLRSVTYASISINQHYYSDVSDVSNSINNYRSERRGMGLLK